MLGADHQEPPSARRLACLRAHIAPVGAAGEAASYRPDTSAAGTDSATPALRHKFARETIKLWFMQDGPREKHGGLANLVILEGERLLPAGVVSDTVVVFMHPVRTRFPPIAQPGTFP